MKPLLPQDTQIRKPFFIGTLGLLASIIFLLIFWLRLPPEVPLFYSRPWGQEQLANPIFLWLPPALAGLTILVNSILVSFFGENQFLKKALATSAVVVTLLAVITVVRIIFLVS